jgi:hypothetical protein
VATGSPSKPPKGGVRAPDGSAVKLPPVKGYKLDQLALSEVGENIMKKTMDHVDAVGAMGHTTYKNPQTRKLIQSLDNASKVKRSETRQTGKKGSPAKKKEEVKPETSPLP